MGTSIYWLFVGVAKLVRKGMKNIFVTELQNRLCYYLEEKKDLLYKIVVFCKSDALRTSQKNENLQAFLQCTMM